MQSSIKKPNGRSTKHTRSGCRTCKIRRVKCDEAKPACLRCTKFFGECDGYESKKETMARLLSSKPLLLPKTRLLGMHQPALVAPIFSSQQDHQYFDLFINNSSFEFIPYCSNPSRHMLHDLLRGPFVIHGAMAMGALHMALIEAIKPGHSKISAREHHIQAIKHYDRALQSMKNIIISRNTDLRCLLLNSLLCFGFEAMTGNSNLAQNQIQVGLNLIEEFESSHANGDDKPLGFNDSTGLPLRNDLCDYFSRLELQDLALCERRKLHVKPMPQGPYNIDRMPPRFLHSFQAQNILQVLMKRSQYLRAYVPKVPHDTTILTKEQEMEFLESNEIFQEGKRLQATDMRYLARWKSSFDSHYATQTDDSFLLMDMILGLHYKMSVMMLKTLFDSVMSYDALTSEFEEMVDISASAMKLSNVSTVISKFHFDGGTILTLFLVGVKCRVWGIRQRAIRLLVDFPRREGVWDSAYAGRLAAWVADFEERWREVGVDGGEGTVPLWARISEYDTEYDLQKRSADVSCWQQEKIVGENGEERFVKVLKRTTIRW